jgi:hypothetical protein
MSIILNVEFHLYKTLKPSLKSFKLGYKVKEGKIFQIS